MKLIGETIRIESSNQSSSNIPMAADHAFGRCSINMYVVVVGNLLDYFCFFFVMLCLHERSNRRNIVYVCSIFRLCGYDYWMHNFTLWTNQLHFVTMYCSNQQSKLCIVCGRQVQWWMSAAIAKESGCFLFFVVSAGNIMYPVCMLSRLYSYIDI